MEAGTLIAVLSVLAAAAYIGRLAWRFAKGEGGYCFGCHEDGCENPPCGKRERRER